MVYVPSFVNISLNTDVIVTVVELLVIELKKGSKIKRKKLTKARLTGKKTAQTKRTGAGSLRLKGAQIKKKGQKGKSTAPRVKGKGPVKSKVVRPKK